MASAKQIILVVVTVVGCGMAAPKPISLEEVGRKIKDFGQRALPAVRGACGFINSYQGYPQGPGYPQVPGYPQAPGYPRYPQVPSYPKVYPQISGYPQYPSYFPQFPQNNVPVSSDPFNENLPSGVASEQDDLNNLDSFNKLPELAPPEVQDVFRNFNTLPKVDGSAQKVVKSRFAK